MLPDAEELRRLREGLRSEDPVVRDEARMRLLPLLDAGARAILAEAVASDSAEVRARAEALLAELDEQA